MREDENVDILPTLPANRHQPQPPEKVIYYYCNKYILYNWNDLNFNLTQNNTNLIT